MRNPPTLLKSTTPSLYLRGMYELWTFIINFRVNQKHYLVGMHLKSLWGFDFKLSKPLRSSMRKHIFLRILTTTKKLNLAQQRRGTALVQAYSRYISWGKLRQPSRSYHVCCIHGRTCQHWPLQHVLSSTWQEELSRSRLQRRVPTNVWCATVWRIDVSAPWRKIHISST